MGLTVSWKTWAGLAVAGGLAYAGFRLLPGAVAGLGRLGGQAEQGLNQLGGGILDFFGVGSPQNTPTDVDDTSYEDYLNGGDGGASPGYPTFCESNPELCQDAAGDQEMEPAGDTAGTASDELVDELVNRLTDLQAQGQQNYIEATAKYVQEQRRQAAQPSLDEQIQIQRESAAAVRAAALARQAEIDSYSVEPTTDMDYYDTDDTGELTEPTQDTAPEPIINYDDARERAYSTRTPVSGLGGPGHQGGSLPPGIQEAIDRVRNNQGRINQILSAAIDRQEVDVNDLDAIAERRRNIVNREETIARIYSDPDNSNNPIGLQTAEQLRAGIRFLQSPAGRGLGGSERNRLRGIQSRYYQLFRLGESNYNPYSFGR